VSRKAASLSSISSMCFLACSGLAQRTYVTLKVHFDGVGAGSRGPVRLAFFHERPWALLGVRMIPVRGEWRETVVIGRRQAQFEALPDRPERGLERRRRSRRDLLGDLDGTFHERVLRHDFAHEADFECTLGRKALVLAHAYHPGDALERDPAGEADRLERAYLADVDVGVDERRGVAADHDVAVRYEVKAGSGTHPVDRGDHRLE